MVITPTRRPAGSAAWTSGTWQRLEATIGSGQRRASSLWQIATKPQEVVRPATPAAASLCAAADEAVDQTSREPIGAHHPVERRLLDDLVAHREGERAGVTEVADHPGKAGVEHDDAQSRHRLRAALRLLRHDPLRR